MTVAALQESGRTASPTTIFQGVGDWLLIALGWALAVAFGVYIAGGITGAHLNPAATLAFAVKRDFSWSKVPGYFITQAIGAFLSAALIFDAGRLYPPSSPRAVSGHRDPCVPAG